MENEIALVDGYLKDDTVFNLEKIPFEVVATIDNAGYVIPMGVIIIIDLTKFGFLILVTRNSLRKPFAVFFEIMIAKIVLHPSSAHVRQVRMLQNRERYNMKNYFKVIRLKIGKTIQL